MARIVIIFVILLSLVVAIVSADYTGYGTKPKPKQPSEMKEKPVPIGIEGIILCKSGSEEQPIPIKGATARITCLGVNDEGYEMAPFSVSSSETDEQGYFLATLYPSELSQDLKLTECKAFLEDSPLEACNVPTDDNNGISGALLSSYRFLNDKKMKLYSVGPFSYTTQPPASSSSSSTLTNYGS